MDKTAAQSSTKKVMGEIFSLTPSSLVELFEIDITSIAVDAGILSASDTLFNYDSGVFRFHNNIKLSGTSLWWRGMEYVALPVQIDGFETTSKGTLPTPKLRLSVNESGVNLLATLKEKMYQMGDLVGAKVTRIRTFLKYLDAKNYLETILPGQTFEPDSNVELPRDVYYIDRKSGENKFVLEFELASLLDIEGIKLPGRLVNATKCLHRYRGEGCNYEDRLRKTTIHGDATLPTSAPPVANDKDELITDILSITTVRDRGLYQKDTLYLKGDSVFLTKSNLNYYFVAMSNNPPTSPPNTRYWVSDNCSKLIGGCRLRWKDRSNALPFGGFPAVNKLAG